MTTPFVINVRDDLKCLHALLDMKSDKPIHLTTTLYPLPAELAQLQKLSLLRIEAPYLVGEYPNFSNATRILVRVFKQILKRRWLRIKTRKRNHYHFDKHLEDWGRLENLETLIIEANIFRLVIPDSFYNLKNLRHLHISNNWLPYGIKEAIANFTKLETLEIKTLYKGKIPEAIGQLKHLKRLIVRDTGVYLEGGSNIEVPETIWDLTTIQELRIGPGYTGELLDASRLVNLKQLEVVELVLPITSVPDDFWELPNLREVHLRAWEQTEIPSLANTVITSLALYMSKVNHLPALPPKLEKLELSLGIDTFPSLVKTHLVELSLDRMELETIPDLPDTLENLRLSYLPVSKLPDLPPSLKVLDIKICDKLEALPNLPKSLETLIIGFCRKLIIPDALHLNLLWIQHSDLTHLPRGLDVDTIILDFCENIRELPDDLVVHSRISMTGMNLARMPKFPEHVQVHIYEDY